MGMCCSKGESDAVRLALGPGSPPDQSSTSSSAPHGVARRCIPDHIGPFRPPRNSSYYSVMLISRGWIRYTPVSTSSPHMAKRFHDSYPFSFSIVGSSCVKVIPYTQEESTGKTLLNCSRHVILFDWMKLVMSFYAK